MSSPAAGIVSTPTIYGKVDYGPTFGQVFRPLNPKRIVTAAGPVTVLPFDVFIIVAQTVPAAWSMELPDLNLWMLYPYGGFELTVKNLNIGFDGTVTAFAGQTVDGLPSIVIGDSQGVGATVISPLPDRSGWMTL
jgi:hypothetical protein